MTMLYKVASLPRYAQTFLRNAEGKAVGSSERQELSQFVEQHPELEQRVLNQLMGHKKAIDLHKNVVNPQNLERHNLKSNIETAKHTRKAVLHQDQEDKTDLFHSGRLKGHAEGKEEGMQEASNAARETYSKMSLYQQLKDYLERPGSKTKATVAGTGVVGTGAGLVGLGRLTKGNQPANKETEDAT